MSGYLRRTISNRVLRTLSKQGKLASSEVERLERNIALLVRTHDVKKKTRIGDPQFKVDVAELSKIVGLSDTQDLVNILQQGISEDIIQECKQEKGTLSLRVNSDQFCQDVLQTVQREGGSFGTTAWQTCYAEGTAPQNVLVEYSSPNIAKPFHAGHLRSTIIGNFIANVYKQRGHRVHRVNFLGDWGTQFGLLALGFQRYGDAQLLKDDPLLQLFKVYVQINQIVEGERRVKINQTYAEGMQLFSKLEKGDPEMLALWKQFRDLSLGEYSKMYERLGVHFDETQCESQFSEKTQKLMDSLKDKNLLQFDEKGVGYMTVDDNGSDLKATLMKSDGSSLYLARDVAAALERHKQHSPDKVHYVVEGGQELHFRQLVGVLRQLQLPWAHRPVEDIHIRFGRIEGMSSRRGNVVFLRDILDESRDRLFQSMKERKTTRTEDLERVADALAVSAIVIQDMKGRRKNNYTFSWDRMLSFSGDSGVFLQYAHARLCSLLESCDVPKTDSIDMSCLHSDTSYQLLQFISRYPELVEECEVSLEPCQVVQYLLKLCHLVNGAYSTLPIKGEVLEIAQARLLVFDCARQVLSNGLHLVGIEPVRQM